MSASLTDVLFSFTSYQVSDYFQTIPLKINMNVLESIYKMVFLRMKFTDYTKMSQDGLNIYVNSYTNYTDTTYTSEYELTTYHSLSLYNSSGSLLNKDITIMIFV